MASRRFTAALRSLRTRADAVIRQPANDQLQLLKEKEKLPWGQLSMEEKVTLYRAAYGQTRKEMMAGDNDGVKVALGVAAGLCSSFLLFKWLQSYAEPAPRTMNPEWKAAERKRHIEERGANPITNNLHKN